MPWLMPSMIAGRASGIFTFSSSCMRLAPNDDAASTAVAETSRRPAVTSRITTGIAYSTEAITPGTRPTLKSATTGTR